ncbi:MAG: Asp-tRNA(Asn)/Glu-tRNA(Gln) amidotransferase subunit GatC [Opitutae bacterium]|nr:Asp-tRNA(Asn)/Glu-tRNA(Gln) amidotransferase subunit GatC [Opitutae bacterium]
MSQPPDLNIDYVARLARLELTPDERRAYAAQLGGILHYLDVIKQADVSGVEPSAHPLPIHNVWREDRPQPGLTVEQALQNAPRKRDDQFVVPRVID